MFCEKCGAQIEDNALFCEHCGQKVGNADAVGAQSVHNVPNMPNVQNMPNAQPNTAGGAPVGTNIKLDKKQMGIIAAVIVVIIAAVIIKSNWKYTINLNDYLKVDFSGYDTVGTATVSFDSEKFSDKYSKKIKPAKGHKKSEVGDVGVFFENVLSGCYTDSFEDLSNGDQITVVWNGVSEELAKSFNCKIKFENAEFTVEGLTEIAKMDPFEHIVVTFEGIAPNGRVNIENNNVGAFEDISFHAEDYDTLSNGDEIVIKASGYYTNTNRYLAEKYGIVMSQTEKKYTVSGLESYVTSKAQLSESIINSLKAQTEDVITSVVARWDERSSLKSHEYVGYYLLTIKDIENYGDKNRIYMIYKFTQSFKTDEYNPAVDFTYYYTVSYEDIKVNDKGEGSLNLNDYSTCYDSFDKDFNFGRDHDVRSRDINGYQTIDEFVQKCVNVCADKYKSETDIS